MIQKRHVIIAIIVMTTVIVSLIIWAVLPKGDDTTIKVENKQTTKNSLTITNLGHYSKDLLDSQKHSIEQVLYQKVGGKGRVTGEVREGSYKKHQQNSYTNVDFLVDFPSVKQTYHISATIAGPDNYRAVNIFCPTKEELHYKPFECKDVNDL